MMEDGQIVAEELEEKVGRLGNDLKEVLRLSR